MLHGLHFCSFKNSISETRNSFEFLKELCYNFYDIKELITHRTTYLLFAALEGGEALQLAWKLKDFCVLDLQLSVSEDLSFLLGSFVSLSLGAVVVVAVVCVCARACACPCSVMSDLVTPWTVAHLPGSSVHGIFQAQILEWVAISSSK